MNKAGKIGATGALLLGVIAVAGSYFTGKQAENFYLQGIERINGYLSQQGISAQISDVTFDRHFFSSDVAYQIKLNDFSDPIIVQADGVLYHGPFPLNRLKQFKFSPVLASAESYFLTPKKLNDVFSSPALLEAQSDISYQGNLQISAKFSSLDLNGILKISSGNVSYNGSSIEVKIPHLQYADPNSSIKTSYENGHYIVNFTQKSSYPYLHNGYYSVDIDRYTFSDLVSGFNFRFHQAKSEGNLRIENQRMIFDQSSQAKMQLLDDKLEKTADLGNLKAYTSFNLDAASFSQFLVVLFKQLPQDRADSILHEMFVQSPKFHLDKLTWQHPKGESDLRLALNVNGNVDPTKFLQLLQSSTLDLQLDLTEVEAVLADIYRLDPQMQGREEQQAKAFCDQLKGYAAPVGVKAVDNKLNLSLKVQGNKLVINDIAVSETELQGLLFLLSLGIN